MSEDIRNNPDLSEHPDTLTPNEPISKPLEPDSAENPAGESVAPENLPGESVDEAPESADKSPDTPEEPAPEPEPEPVPEAEKAPVRVYPLLTVEAKAAPTLCSRLFNGLSLLYPLILTALLLGAAFFQLQHIRGLWAPEETVLAEVLKNMLNGDWIVLQFNGSVYYDAPPLYFWFLAGIYKLLAWPALGFLHVLLPHSLAALMFIGAALSSLFLLWATLFAARYVAGFDRRGCFASGCVLLGFFLFAGTLHYNCMDTLFAALVVMAEAMMFLALKRSSSMWRMGLGFAFAALAFLVKGLPGLLVPVACAVLFAFWQARPWRLLRKDFLLGFIASLLPVVLWVGSIWASGHHEVVVRLIREHFIGPVLNGWQFNEAWWYYCLVLPLMLLPWAFLILFPNWLGLFSKGAFKVIAGAFRGAYQGLSFTWLSLLCAGAGFLFLSSKQPAALLLLVPPLAIIAGRLILGLSPLRNMFLHRLFALFFILLALIFAVLPVYISGQAPSVLDWLGGLGIPVLGVEIGGAYIIALACLVAGCLFIGGLNSRRPEGMLLVMLLLVTGLSWPVSLLAAPSLDKIMSPQSACPELEQYAGNGYAALSLGVPVAPFVHQTGGAGMTLLQDAEALERMRNENGKFILLAEAEAWDKLPEKPALTEVRKFRLAAGQYVLLAHEGAATAPAEAGQTPAGAAVTGAPEEETASSAPPED
ncbi:MAG: hypothetical protein LBM00_02460 [Deltaproteobacteria bacterium]|jgi:4-amino-4-deoxy-L-arabinose transferase-like glycosyltransferase|nr:hypothetical protein [Deltaproteobacteria bacterium]